jgi:hypothetical protein
VNHLERLLGLLPPPYSVARDSVIARTLEVIAAELEAFQEDLDRMRQTHWIKSCYRLEDAAKLGALVGVRPLSWENLPLFRLRLQSTVAARLKGALGPNEIRDFVYRYLHDAEAAMDASLVPGLQTVTSADAYRQDPSRPLFRPLAFEENPPALRESSVLASRGGNVPYLFRWEDKNQGLEETVARLDVTGVIGKLTTTPVIANLTTGDLVGFRGALGFGKVLTISAAGTDPTQPRLAKATIDGTDVTASLFSVSAFEMGEPLRLDRIDPSPLVPRLARGENEFVFLSIGMFSIKGLNRYFSSTAADDLREGVFDETRFDHTLFPSGRVARLAMSWYETQGAMFEVRVPRYIVREPSGSALHEDAARGLEGTIDELRAAGVDAVVRYMPFVEAQPQPTTAMTPWIFLEPERASAGENAQLIFGGVFGETLLGEALFV